MSALFDDRPAETHGVSQYERLHSMSALFDDRPAATHGVFSHIAHNDLALPQVISGHHSQSMSSLFDDGPAATHGVFSHIARCDLALPQVIGMCGHTLSTEVESLLPMACMSACGPAAPGECTDSYWRAPTAPTTSTDPFPVCRAAASSSELDAASVSSSRSTPPGSCSEGSWTDSEGSQGEAVSESARHIVGIVGHGQLIEFETSLLSQCPGTVLQEAFSDVGRSFPLYDQSGYIFLRDCHGYLLLNHSLDAVEPIILWLQSCCDSTPLQPAIPPVVHPQHRQSWINLMVQFGFDAVQLRRAGVAAEELALLGVQALSLAQGGFSIDELATAGYDLRVLSKCFTALQLICAGFAVEDLLTCEVSIGDLVRGGLTIEEVQPYCAFCKVRDLVDAGFTVSHLRSTCFSPEELLNDFSVCELVNGGFSLVQVRPYCSWHDIRDLLDLQNMQALLQANFSIQDLRCAGAMAKDLQESGCTCKQLKDGGFELADIMDSAFSACDIAAAGFPADEISAEQRVRLCAPIHKAHSISIMVCGRMVSAMRGGMLVGRAVFASFSDGSAERGECLLDADDEAMLLGDNQSTRLSSLF